MLKANGHIKTSVSVAVQLIDSYTNRIISGSKAQVSIEDDSENKLKPILKSEGYYVFVNIAQPVLKLCIKSPFYQEYNATIDIKSLDHKNPIYKISLNPSESYPFVNGVTLVKGMAEPNTNIYVAFTKSLEFMRLLSDVSVKKSETNNKVKIFNPANYDLSERAFLIFDPKSDKSEIIKIADYDEESEEFIAHCELQNSYKKISAKVVPVSKTRADKDGNYFIALPYVSKESNEYAAYIYSDENKCLSVKTGEVSLGTLNKIDLI